MVIKNNLTCVFLYLLIGFVFSFNKTSGQLSNYLYGIRSDSANYYFSRIDLSNNHTQNLSILSLPQYLNSTMSTCADFINNVYYISDFGTLTGYSALDGSIVSTDYSGVIQFGFIAFNPCDTSIYGITDRFTKYKIATRAFSTIGTLPNQFMCAGCLSVIDPENNIFIYQAPDSLKGLSLASGEKVFSNAIISPGGEGFGHISYDCNSHKVFGTSWDNTYTKYLSTIDPLTGIVSHVSETGWTSGFWKPLWGGDCIDQNSEIFYYAGDTVLNGISINDGSVVYSLNYPEYHILFMQNFSGCSCAETEVQNTSNKNIDITLSPNPFYDKTLLSVKNYVPGKNLHLHIVDVFGKEINQLEIDKPSLEINMQRYSPGIYFYQLMDNDEIIASGKMICTR